ncbi:MAG TPA: hypothetical protein VN908_10645 [Gemmatimonadales bacterium]|nr:hypothetical protein [Gemmatimonadales bacterium]
MRSTWFNRATGCAALLALFTATLDVPAAAARPEPGKPRRPRVTNLFAAAGLLLNVNRQVCGLANTGQVCVAFAGSPVGGGGFWPKGTPDQYTFQSGIQLAGVIPNIPGFAWSGDTIGAFFVDTRGTQEQGDGLSLIYNALNAQDVETWPNGGIIRDTSLFDPVLIGRKSASQGDSWVREWEGDPAFLSGRTHPMGIALDQRSLAWNFPTGNEDIIYFIFTFYNITARASSGKYNNPTIDPALQAEIGAVGDKFQDLNEQKFPGLQIPDTGYTITSMYSAFTMDADVANFSTNYGTAVLPFNMGLEYAGDFLPDPGWQFPPDIFGAPFYAAPGFIGVKYLRSPESSPGNQVGLTMFSTFVNSATGFPDPVGVRQLYRYLSGFLGGSDFPCNSSTVPATARALKLCFLAQFQSDARFFEASGPFNLPAGQARTIVVAYVQAAPLAAPLLALPGGGPGGDNPPGIPATGDSIFANPAKVRGIERVMGWVSQADTGGGCNVARVNGKCPAGQGRPDSIIQQNEVRTAPRSLLNKALVAQAVFDNKFLLPFAPEAPQFFLVPGNNQVTVVWQKSVSEATGDPYFLVASNPTSPLYDPNFRKFDVEGYRIYRGRTAGQLELIAQFDYDGTQLIDFTGGFDYSGDLDGDGLSQCAPELGLQADCPVVFSTSPPYINSVPHPLTGKVIQIPPGGRVKLADGNVFILRADTAVSGGPPACANVSCPELTSGGVPFAFVDTDVRNSFTYFYTVTAFDVNSVVSGPTSLESPRVTKPIVPRAPSGQEAGGSVTTPVLLDRAGATINASAPLPTLASATAIFSGPMPPTNGFTPGVAAFTPALVGGGTVTITIDSILPGHGNTGTTPGGSYGPATYFVSVAGPTGTVQVTLPLTVSGLADDASVVAYAPAAKLDQTKARPFGGDTNFSMSASIQLQSAGTWRLQSWGRGDANSNPTRSAENGPRLWAGTANETQVRPNSGVCNPGVGTCGTSTPVPNIGLTAGTIAGFDIFSILGYLSVTSGPMRDIEAVGSTVTRAADFAIYWGTTPGAIDSVLDVTHNVVVPFKTKMRASWGILDTSSFAGTPAVNTADGNNALLTWSDIACVDPVTTLVGLCGGGPTPAVLKNAAKLSPVAFATSSYAGTSALAANGNGFILYLNGHFFLIRATGALPTSTVWHARFYSGRVRANAAGTAWTFAGSRRPPTVPGLRAQFQFTGSTFSAAVTNDSVLAKVHTVPDPYYVTNALEFTQNAKVLKFVNVPMRAIVRIYSVSGVLVRVLTHDDPTGGAEVTWNLRNRNNQFVASGVYFYHVETPDGKSKVGRFTVVNFAP